MRFSLITVTLLGTFLLGACAQQMPPVNFSVPNVVASHKKIDAELKSLTVTMARPEEQLGTIDFILAESSGMSLGTGGSISAIWKEALVEALNRTAIFNDNSAKKISISVKILKMEHSGPGGGMSTDTIARYEIIDRQNGGILYTQDISSVGSVAFDYAFIGAIRARESINRSVQGNISTFLDTLEAANISALGPSGSRL